MGTARGFCDPQKYTEGRKQIRVELCAGGCAEGGSSNANDFRKAGYDLEHIRDGENCDR